MTTRILNIAILLVAVVLSGLLIWKYFLAPPAQTPNYQLAKDAQLRIDGVDWTDSERTVLLALSKECKYCSGSAAFYRRLAAGIASQTNTRLLAVFSEKDSAADAYLKELEVPINNLAYASLPSLGIKSVPSLALVDSKGVVTYMWVGKLPPLEEKGLMSKLGLVDTRPPDEWSITEANLARKLANKEQLVLLDIQDREAYTKNHREGARNIPLDELPVRAQDELPLDQTIVVYSSDPSESDLAWSILETHGFTRVVFLVPDATPAKQ